MEINIPELEKIVKEKQEQNMYPYLVTISPDLKTITITFAHI